MIIMLAMAAAWTTTGQGEFFQTGNNLWAMCNEPPQRLACVTYLAGVADASVTLRKFGVDPLICEPNDVEEGQSADVVINYMRDRPENRHIDAPDIIIGALSSTWPCPHRGE